MKRTTIFFIAIAISALITASATPGGTQKNPEKGDKPKQEQNAKDAAAQKKSQEAVANQSGWLNAKNLPQYFAAPCPFYMEVKTGC